MTVHASDVALVILDALNASGSVGTISLIATPNPAQDFPNRDGRHEYVCAGRDCVRGFHIQVDAIPFADADRLAHPEQYETTCAGETSDDIETLLAGLDVDSIGELKRLVDKGRAWERHITRPRPDPVSSDASRGASVRQPHGCEGQLQQ